MHVARTSTQVCGQGGQCSPLRIDLGAPHIPRRRQGAPRNAGQPVQAARRGGRRDRGHPEGPDIGARPVSEFTIARSLPHGHVAVVAAMARQLGLPALLGPPCRSRTPGVGVDRLPGGAAERSWLPWLWWADTTLGVDLGITDASTDEIYAAMDWLVGRQDSDRKETGR